MGRSPLLYDALTSPVDNDVFFLRDAYAREGFDVFTRGKRRREEVGRNESYSAAQMSPSICTYYEVMCGDQENARRMAKMCWID